MDRDELQAALADVVAGTTVRELPRPAQPQRRAGVVHLDDEDLRLPPIRRSAPPARNVAEALRRSGAGSLLPFWYVVREALMVGALFWAAVILLAFAFGTDDLFAPFLAAVVVRSLWLATRTVVGQAA